MEVLAVGAVIVVVDVFDLFSWFVLKLKLFLCILLTRFVLIILKFRLVGLTIGLLALISLTKALLTLIVLTVVILNWIILALVAWLVILLPVAVVVGIWLLVIWPSWLLLFLSVVVVLAPSFVVVAWPVLPGVVVLFIGRWPDYYSWWLCWLRERAKR